MIPTAIESRSIIACLAFGQANFHLRINVTNMFQNALQFFGKTTGNTNAHILRFSNMCITIEYPEVSVMQFI